MKFEDESSKPTECDHDYKSVGSTMDLTGTVTTKLVCTHCRKSITV